MKERPILFSGPMVQAILDGRKTQTRRVMRLQPSIQPSVHGPGQGIRGPKHADCTIANWSGESEFDVCDCHCPYGAPGDRLWVRETWGIDDACEEWDDLLHPLDKEIIGKPCLRYKAEGSESVKRWRPSIHMPRWASRITLEITGIRVERLQEISKADCIAEGISEVLFRPDDGFPLCYGYMVGKDDRKTGLVAKPQDAYQGLWESINGAGSWEANPWVWVVEFRRVEA